MSNSGDPSGFGITSHYQLDHVDNSDYK